MPVFTDLARTDLLGGLSIKALSLHIQYDPAGGHELVGGLPAYARIVPTFAAPVAGVESASSLPYTFDVPAGSTVAWLGMWDLGGAFLGMTPNGGGVPKIFVVTDPVDGTLHCPQHGFNSGDQIVPWRAQYLPDGTVWVVTVVDPDNLTLLDLASNPPTFLAAFSGYLQLIIQQTFAVQGTFPVSSFALNVALIG